MLQWKAVKEDVIPTSDLLHILAHAGVCVYTTYREKEGDLRPDVVVYTFDFSSQEAEAVDVSMCLRSS